MSMYGIPLAPHELDALPQANRELAIIEQADSDMEMACDELHKPTVDELEEYKDATTDLWHNLKALLDALDYGEQDEIDEAITDAKRSLLVNKGLE